MSSISTTIDNQPNKMTTNCRISLTSTRIKLLCSILLLRVEKTPQRLVRPYETLLGRRSLRVMMIFNNSINNKRKLFLMCRLTSLRLLIKSFSQKSKKNLKKPMNNKNQAHSNTKIPLNKNKILKNKLNQIK